MSKILAIDYGTQNIGLALGTTEEKLAVPLKIIQNKSSDLVIEEIENICQLEGIKKVIIGLPVSMQGKATDMTLKVENFIHQLSAKTNLMLETVDERFSTKEVAKQFQQVDFKNKKDAAAAALILQTYLDKNNF